METQLSQEQAYAKPGLGLNVILWIVAVLIMFTAISYQRLTGPTHPLRGTIEIGTDIHKYKLVRSANSDEDAKVRLPAAAGSITGNVYYKRYKTDDDYIKVELRTFPEDEEQMFAPLPKQPAAGKLEYYLELNAGGSSKRVPATGEDNIVIRYKDPVPTSVLLPHVLMMTIAIMVGIRTALSAIASPFQMRKMTFITLGVMTVGGMILGPIVQKYAFGEYWTGFPFGYDLTDNKMAIMWVSWILAAIFIGFKQKPNDFSRRVAVIVAAIVMTGVYMIPHSMRGSELDYSKIDAGVSAQEAIGTSDK
jgi:hypothetical protein